MTKLELTSEQRHDISVELNASDIYETLPFLNHVLKVLGYSDRLDDDSEREELRWTKPAEPLIKDEKIRKAVRAWAEACELDTAQYDEYWRSFRCDDCVIGFKTEDVVLNLDGGEWYTIAELCGEED